MKIKVTAAICACKLSRWLLRVTGRGGTALPGKLALRICPNLLGELAQNVKTVVLTGTNGKTTSARMVEQAFSDKGMSYFANRSGSNLIQGITAEFAANSTNFGRMKKEYAVIECDEAACKKVLGFLQPKVVAVTNIFRDQLDRYGEITHTLNNIKEGLTHTPEAVLCLNADCSLTASLAGDLPNKCVFFGVNVPIYKAPVTEVSDAAHCIRCKGEYEYDWRTYGHLGGFRCPKCGYSRPEASVAVEKILSLTTDSSTVELSAFGEKVTTRINLPAGYNIYNAAGSVAALLEMGFDLREAIGAVEHFECGFGRMETFVKDGTDIRMILVKNPAGCNQVMNFLCETDGKATFCVCLNDNTADGTDVSWIWDAEFEKLCDMGDNLVSVLVGGVRALDMAMRLKYAGVPEEKMTVIEDYDALIAAMSGQKTPVFVMPTYTAMLELRSRLSHATGGSEFWE
jgi:UDP-N-acetylmuramyl tripeptide synthase